MPGGQWAARTIPEIKSTIETSQERALRVTYAVRAVINGPDREVIREEIGKEEVKDTFFSNLADSLNSQPGSSVEERWNNLVEEYNLPKITEKGVYILDSEVYLAFGCVYPDNDGPYYTDTLFEGSGKKAILGRSLLEYGRRGEMDIEKFPGGLLVDGERFEAVGRFGQDKDDGDSESSTL
jgi:hypothetical protein